MGLFEYNSNELLANERVHQLRTAAQTRQSTPSRPATPVESKGRRFGLIGRGRAGHVPQIAG